MLYAKFMHPNNGWENDVKRAKEAELKVGERYKVDWISMGGFCTSIFLMDFKNAHFNSVQFDFEEEDGTPVDIYNDSRYNPYMCEDFCE